MREHKTIESLIANTLRELNHKDYYDDDPKITHTHQHKFGRKWKLMRIEEEKKP